MVSYGDGEFTVVRPGRYVICAVSGRRVPLDVLEPAMSRVLRVCAKNR